jgi:hypothetical protein
MNQLWGFEEKAKDIVDRKVDIRPVLQYILMTVLGITTTYYLHLGETAMSRTR